MIPFEINISYYTTAEVLYCISCLQVNTKNQDMDVNVTGVWERNVTGQGVTVAVVDDGVEWTNPDLKDNYNSAGSWDLNSDDPNPTPSASKGIPVKKES